MKKGQNIFLIGPPGAGKSTIGKLLAKELALDFYDSDHEIVKKAGADLRWIFDLEGEAGFRLREEQAISKLTALSNIILATGGDAVLSPHNCAMLAARGQVIYLQVSFEQQFKRLEQNSHDRPQLAGLDLRTALLAMREQREAIYQQLADVVVATEQISARALVEKIVNKLEQRSVATPY